MKKNIKKTISSLVRMVSLNSIRPFAEKPSVETEKTAEPGAPPMNHATELFERFTADIIRERVVFTR